MNSISTAINGASKRTENTALVPWDIQWKNSFYSIRTSNVINDYPKLENFVTEALETKDLIGSDKEI